MKIYHLTEDQFDLVYNLAKKRRPDLYPTGQRVIGRSYRDRLEAISLYREICEELGF